MTRPLRLLVAVLIALGTIGISAAHPTHAAGTQVANCSFATLQTDLQAGGVWYYTAGQCPSPIIFTSTIDISSSSASLTAQGNDVTLDGGHTSTVTGVQLFSVGSGMTFGLTGLTLSHGYRAINNSGELTITSSTLSGNSAGNSAGGAIYNTGTLTITGSTLSGNSATDGGAISNNYSGTVAVTSSTLSGNSGGNYGGAVVSAGGSSGDTVTITNSTLSGNSAPLGGAIYSDYSSTVTITNSALSSNSATSYGGAIYATASSTTNLINSTLSGSSALLGGAIYSTYSGAVTITNSTLSSSSATSFGGAIYDQGGGTVTVISSTLSGSSAGNSGGAIWNNDGYGGKVTITDSILSGNSAASYGGATYGRVTITSSTLSSNSADTGGAIYNYTNNTMTVTNSTFTGNSATSDGGAIYNSSGGKVTVTSSTLSGNSAPLGGAIYNNQGTVTTGGSIIASSTGGNCDNVSPGTMSDTGYNLEWSGAGHTDTCGFGGAGKHDMTGTDPQLGSLADNGGPTQTMALASSSPAIDQIPTSSGLCPATDQRGVARPDDGEASCDIGAYEFGGISVPISTGWTLLGVPLKSSFSASGLIGSINGQLGSSAASVLATYVNGRFDLYVQNYTPDQALGPSQGIFVLSSKAGTWMPPGSAYSVGQPVSLQPGWNLATSPYPVGGLNGDGINAEIGPSGPTGCTLQEIATYSGGSYHTYTPSGGPAGTGFHVPITAGMWIECTNAYSWTPS